MLAAIARSVVHNLRAADSLRRFKYVLLDTQAVAGMTVAVQAEPAVAPVCAEQTAVADTAGPPYTDAQSLAEHVQRSWAYFKKLGSPKWHVAPMVDQVIGFASPEAAAVSATAIEILCFFPSRVIQLNCSVIVHLCGCFCKEAPAILGCISWLLDHWWTSVLPCCTQAVCETLILL